MKTQTLKPLLIVLTCAAAFTLAACNKKKTVGEKIDDALDQRPAEEVQDAAEEFSQGVEDAVEELKEGE